jgi:hypothetical protein
VSEGLPYRLDQWRLLVSEDGADIEYQFALAQPGHNGRRSQSKPASQFGIADRSRLGLDDP